jgi:ABC-type uncharacterized transport system substrate-binding protein
MMLNMKRRDFITLLGGGAVVWPLAARAQQPDGMRRIGALFSAVETDPEGQARAAALRQGLQKLGWTEGRNLRIEYRWAGGSLERMRPLAAELITLNLEVLFAAATASLVALQQATHTVPIVFAQVTDPVGAGFVASLARPGGNITGVTQHDFTIGVKWLELLKQLAPRVTRVAVLYDPGATNRELVIGLAARHRLPAVYAFRYHVVSGGLASYGIDNIGLYRVAARHVDRILRGEKPAELPLGTSPNSSWL